MEEHEKLLLTGALAPIVSRVVTSHCWKKHDGKLSHLKQPLTEARLKQHVNGSGAAYGAAQIQPGSSTTRVAVFDLDSHKGETPWQEMQWVALEIMGALESRGLRPIPFRSSGGHGIHIYLIWDEPQDAYSVRFGLKAALESCGFRDGTKGVSSKEIEISPKQNSVPADGFGNMVVLPLAGSSVPLDAFELEDLEKSAAASMEWPVSSDVPVLVREQPVAPIVGDVSVELETLKSALDAIPNSGDDELDYDAWRNVIFALHHATQGSGEGLALAHEFSARSSKYAPAFLEERVWPFAGKSDDANRAPITARSILFLARDSYGWQEDVSDDFEVVVDEEGNRVNSFELALVRADAPIRPDLIKGVIPDAEFGIIYGKSGSGKSFAAIDLGYHLALGQEWRGRKVKRRKVFYIAAEGAYGVRRRAKAYALHHGVDVLTPFYTRERPVNMHAKNGWVPVATDINEHSAGAPGVIFIDTLSRSIPGVEENSAKDMSQVIENCQMLGRATGCMVIVIAHAGKDDDKGVRGSSTLRAAADFELAVTRHLETQWRCLKLTKSKDDIDGTEFSFTLTSVDVGVDEDGDTVYSAVAVPSDAPPAVVKLPQSKDAQHALAAVIDLAEFSDDGWVDIEKAIDSVLVEYPNESKNARVNVRRWISGANKLVNFDVFDGKVRYSATQPYSDDDLSS